MKKITLFILPILFVFIGASCSIPQVEKLPNKYHETNDSINFSTKNINAALNANSDFSLLVSEKERVSVLIPGDWEYTENLGVSKDNVREFFKITKKDPKTNTVGTIDEPEKNGAIVTLEKVTDPKTDPERGHFSNVHNLFLATDEYPRSQDSSDPKAPGSMEPVSFEKKTINGKDGNLSELILQTSSMYHNDIYHQIEFVTKTAEGEYFLFWSTYGDGSEKEKIRADIMKMINSIQFE